MFWRFGFNSSTLDTLLDKEDVTLEEVLEEEDLLQEAKSMNPKLVELYVHYIYIYIFAFIVKRVQLIGYLHLV